MPVVVCQRYLSTGGAGESLKASLNVSGDFLTFSWRNDGSGVSRVCVSPGPQKPTRRLPLKRRRADRHHTTRRLHRVGAGAASHRPDPTMVVATPPFIVELAEDNAPS